MVKFVERRADLNRRPLRDSESIDPGYGTYRSGPSALTKS